MVVSGKPKRVLVIDQDVEYVNACQECLEEDPFVAYIVHGASSLEKARDMMQQEEFDCALIDNNLPDGLGLKLLEEIMHGGVENTPAAVMVTSKGDANLAVSAMKIGAQDYITKDEMTPELLTKTVRSAVENHELKRQLAQSSKQFEHMALHDALTGLANRTLFNNRLEHSINLAERTGAKLAVMLIDLNGFKPINDTYGHEAGDVVLKEISERLQGCLRRTDTMARLGGDEFAILLEGLASPGDAYHVIRRLLAAGDKPVNYEGQSLQTSLSVGFAVYPESGHQAQVLLGMADEAMYEAKRGKKGFSAPQNFPAPMPVHQLDNYVSPAGVGEGR